jgi:hypothetical protein
MAHDRQVQQELPEELQERKSASPKPTGKQSESLGVLADWWAVYGQIYRDDPTELLAVAFRETLQNLPAAVLHEACLKAQREAPQFRPSPGRIYELAQNLLEARRPGNAIRYPEITQEEREAALEETKDFNNELREKLGLKVGA